VVGVPSRVWTEESAGGGYVMLGPLAAGVDTLPNRGIPVVGEIRDGSAGTDAAAADLNGDSFDDVILGDPTDDEGGFMAGAVYVVYGGPREAL